MRRTAFAAVLSAVTLLITPTTTSAAPGAASGAMDVLTIDRDAYLSPSALYLTVTGTLSCSAGDLRWGVATLRLVDAGPNKPFGFVSGECTGSVQPWAMKVASDSGKFKSGRAAISITGMRCVDDQTCDSVAYADRMINIRK